MALVMSTFFTMQEEYSQHICGFVILVEDNININNKYKTAHGQHSKKSRQTQNIHTVVHVVKSAITVSVQTR